MVTIKGLELSLLVIMRLVSSTVTAVATLAYYSPRPLGYGMHNVARGVKPTVTCSSALHHRCRMRLHAYMADPLQPPLVVEVVNQGMDRTRRLVSRSRCGWQ
jgi:hypothetical protein